MTLSLTGLLQGINRRYCITVTLAQKLLSLLFLNINKLKSHWFITSYYNEQFLTEYVTVSVIGLHIYIETKYNIQVYFYVMQKSACMVYRLHIARNGQFFMDVYVTVIHGIRFLVLS